MDLAQQTGEVIDGVNRVGGNDEIDRGTRGEAKIGDVTEVALHRHLFAFGLAAQVGDSFG